MVPKKVSEADAIDKAAAGFGLQKNNSLSWFWENVPSEYGGLMRLYSGYGIQLDLSSGKRLHNYGKSPFVMGKHYFNGNFQ